LPAIPEPMMAIFISLLLSNALLLLCHFSV
jgi:hypothetical protein